MYMFLCLSFCYRAICLRFAFFRVFSMKPFCSMEATTHLQNSVILSGDDVGDIPLVKTFLSHHCCNQ